MMLDVVQELKNEGNLCFKSSDFNTALNKYEKAVKLCPPNTDPLLHATLQTNIAACYLNKRNWQAAADAASAAVAHDPNNIKALYRRAVAFEKLGNVMQALSSASDAIQHDPKSKPALELIARLRTTVMQQKQEITQLPTDAQLVLSRLLNIDGNLSTEDAEAAESAINVLRTYVIKKNQPQLITNGGAVELTISLLKKWSFPETTSTSISENTSSQHLRLYRLILDLLLCLMEGSSKLVDEDQDQEIRSGKSKVFLFDSPLEVDPITRKSRELITNELGAEFTYRLLSKYIRLGVSHHHLPQPLAPSASVLRTSVCVLLLRCLKYTGCLDDDSNVTEALSLAVGCSESSVIVRSGLEAVGYRADYRRRLGSRVKALRASQPLLKLLENIIQLLGDDELKIYGGDADMMCRTIRYGAEFALSSVFMLLADKDRSPEDQVSVEEITVSLLGPYLSEGREPEDLLAGLRALLLVWLADREAVKAVILSNNLLERLIELTMTGNGTNLRTEAATVLMHCMEFPELRGVLLDTEGCLQDLIDLCAKGHDQIRTKVAVAVARLCVHNENVRGEIFRSLNFYDVARHCFEECGALTGTASSSDKGDAGLGTQAKIAEEDPVRRQQSLHMLQSYLELLLFLSFHGKFKEMMLDNSSDATGIVRTLPQIGKRITSTGDLMSAYYFSAIICNLLRSRKDKETVRKSGAKERLAPELSDEEMDALREFMEKLPEPSRPPKTAHYDRGEENVVEKLSEELLCLDVTDALVQICLMKRQTVSLNVMALAVEALWLLCRQPANRGRLVRAGAVPALLKAGEAFQAHQGATYEDDIGRCRQTLAQICISISPNLLTYRESLDIIPQLLELLRHSYELYQFEAAMAITNLISVSEDARVRMLPLGVTLLLDLITGDNPLCRAAGLEGLCNMAMSDAFAASVATGKYTVMLQLLLAFLGEVENTRAQSAAAGALAMLTVYPAVVAKLVDVSNVNNLLKNLAGEDAKNNDGFKLRLVTTISNICEAPDIEGYDDKHGIEKIKKFRQQIIDTIKTLDLTYFSETKVSELISGILQKHK